MKKIFRMKGTRHLWVCQFEEGEANFSLSYHQTGKAIECEDGLSIGLELAYWLQAQGKISLPKKADVEVDSYVGMSGCESWFCPGEIRYDTIFDPDTYSHLLYEYKTPCRDVLYVSTNNKFNSGFSIDSQNFNAVLKVAAKKEVDLRDNFTWNETNEEEIQTFLEVLPVETSEIPLGRIPVIKIAPDLSFLIFGKYKLFAGVAYFRDTSGESKTISKLLPYKIRLREELGFQGLTLSLDENHLLILKSEEVFLSCPESNFFVANNEKGKQVAWNYGWSLTEDSPQYLQEVSYPLWEKLAENYEPGSTAQVWIFTEGEHRDKIMFSFKEKVEGAVKVEDWTPEEEKEEGKVIKIACQRVKIFSDHLLCFGKKIEFEKKYGKEEIGDNWEDLHSYSEEIHDALKEEGLVFSFDEKGESFTIKKKEVTLGDLLKL